MKLTESDCSGSGGGGEGGRGVVTGATAVHHARLHRLEIVFISCKCEKYLHQLSSRVDESITGVEWPARVNPGLLNTLVGIVFHELSWLLEIIVGAELKL